MSGGSVVDWLSCFYFLHFHHSLLFRFPCHAISLLSGECSSRRGHGAYGQGAVELASPSLVFCSRFFFVIEEASVLRRHVISLSHLTEFFLQTRLSIVQSAVLYSMGQCINFCPFVSVYPHPFRCLQGHGSGVCHEPWGLYASASRRRDPSRLILWRTAAPWVRLWLQALLSGDSFESLISLLLFLFIYL